MHHERQAAVCLSGLELRLKDMVGNCTLVEQIKWHSSKSFLHFKLSYINLFGSKPVNSKKPRPSLVKQWLSLPFCQLLRFSGEGWL